MQPSTKAISLVLIGTATALLGYEAVAPPRYAANDNDGGADFDNYYSSTQPANGYGASGYYHQGHYYHSGSSSFFGSSYNSPYSTSGSGGGSSSHIGGTSRGGFGSSGHAAGHGGS